MYRLIMRMDIADIAAREQARQDDQHSKRGERKRPETWGQGARIPERASLQATS